MKALGLIEVRGMVPAVEALDSALKAANVNRLDVVKVGGGLVSVLIEGDVELSVQLWMLHRQRQKRLEP